MRHTSSSIIRGDVCMASSMISLKFLTKVADAAEDFCTASATKSTLMLDPRN
jgi:hypothetical protein